MGVFVKQMDIMYNAIAPIVKNAIRLIVDLHKQKEMSFVLNSCGVIADRFDFKANGGY